MTPQQQQQYKSQQAMQQQQQQQQQQMYKMNQQPQYSTCPTTGQLQKTQPPPQGMYPGSQMSPMQPQQKPPQMYTSYGQGQPQQYTNGATLPSNMPKMNSPMPAHMQQQQQQQQPYSGYNPQQQQQAARQQSPAQVPGYQPSPNKLNPIPPVGIGYMNGTAGPQQPQQINSQLSPNLQQPTQPPTQQQQQPYYSQQQPGAYAQYQAPPTQQYQAYSQQYNQPAYTNAGPQQQQQQKMQAYTTAAQSPQPNRMAYPYQAHDPMSPSPMAMPNAAAGGALSTPPDGTTPTKGKKGKKGVNESPDSGEPKAKAKRATKKKSIDAKPADLTGVQSPVQQQQPPPPQSQPQQMHQSLYQQHQINTQQQPIRPPSQTQAGYQLQQQPGAYAANMNGGMAPSSAISPSSNTGYPGQQQQVLRQASPSTWMGSTNSVQAIPSATNPVSSGPNVIDFLFRQIIKNLRPDF